MLNNQSGFKLLINSIYNDDVLGTDNIFNTFTTGTIQVFIVDNTLIVIMTFKLAVFIVFYIINISNTLITSLYKGIVRNSDTRKSTLHFES